MPATFPHWPHVRQQSRNQCEARGEHVACELLEACPSPLCKCVPLCGIAGGGSLKGPSGPTASLTATALPTVVYRRASLRPNGGTLGDCRRWVIGRPFGLTVPPTELSKFLRPDAGTVGYCRGWVLQLSKFGNSRIQSSGLTIGRFPLAPSSAIPERLL